MKLMEKMKVQLKSKYRLSDDKLFFKMLELRLKRQPAIAVQTLNFREIHPRNLNLGVPCIETIAEVLRKNIEEKQR